MCSDFSGLDYDVQALTEDQTYVAQDITQGRAKDLSTDIATAKNDQVLLAQAMNADPGYTSDEAPQAAP